jgi:hypothetical protein
MLTISNQERNATTRLSEQQVREGRQRLKLAEVVPACISAIVRELRKHVDILKNP